MPNYKTVKTFGVAIMERNLESVYSNRVKAGKRRTYFFDVKATRGNDYYLVLTESIRRFDDKGFDKHKIFIYKEDFNKFLKGLTEAVDYVKTELMPNFDFDSYNNEYHEQEQAEDKPLSESPQSTEPIATPQASIQINASNSNEEVDKW